MTQERIDLINYIRTNSVDQVQEDSLELLSDEELFHLSLDINEERIAA